jgi:hypothetical protein
VGPVTLFLLVLLLAVGLVVFRRGGPPEWAAWAIIASWILADVAYHLVFGPSTFNKVDPVHVILDSAELVAITWVALRANRMWPLWAAAAQVICVSGHVAALIEPGGMTRAYWAMTQLPQYIQLTALLLGTASHLRRKRQWGEYRSWRYS